eukprot:3655771-Pyramimonas_sp.AAC.1
MSVAFATTGFTYALIRSSKAFTEGATTPESTLEAAGAGLAAEGARAAAGAEVAGAPCVTTSQIKLYCSWSERPKLHRSARRHDVLAHTLAMNKFASLTRMRNKVG